MLQPTISGRSLWLRRCSDSPRYEALFAVIETGQLALEKLIGRKVTPEQSFDALVRMDMVVGVTVLTEF